MIEAYKRFVFFCDMREDAAEWFRPAFKLAAEAGASVTMVGLVPDVEAVRASAMISAAGQVPVANTFGVIEGPQADLDEQASRVAEAFDKLATVENAQHKWRSLRTVPGEMGNEAAQMARVHDLCVVAQPGPGAETAWASTIETLVTTGGRPVLVVPAISGNGQIGNNIQIAWDGSKEAARAVRDALPLMQRRGDVSVAIATDSSSGGSDPVSLGVRLGEYLGAHGVKVTTHVVEDLEGKSVAEELSRLGEEMNADLLVMGGYGESWISEQLFGSVTSEVIDEIRMPVFLSN